MGKRTVEEQKEMIMACLRIRSVPIKEMAKLLKLDNKTFNKKVHNQSFNLFEIVVFANYCGLDMKELIELFSQSLVGITRIRGA